MTIQLRPYQRECLAAAVDTAKRGIKRQLFALPTGTGKTVIFSQFPKMLGGRRALTIAHREELLDQAAEKIQGANPDIRVDVEQAARKASAAADVVVASIQSLARTPERLDRIDPSTIGLIIVDECHHMVARTYLEVLQRFGLCPDVSDLPPQALSRKQLSAAIKSRFLDYQVPRHSPYLFGFTATSHRTDGLGLEFVLDEIAYSKTMPEMMREGWLAPVKGYKVATGVDLSGVKTSRGDFQENQLAATVNTPERNALAVQSYRALASERQALCFCVDVQHTEDMADAFRNAGVRAGVVVGATPKEERRQIIADYKAGLYDVLCNCMVLTEGFDAPETSALVMARPTQSSLLYTQMLGRGTRLAEGKENLLVIDMADTSRVGISTVNTLFGLPPHMDVEEGALKVKEEFDELMADSPVGMERLIEAASLDDVRQMAQEFSPLEQAMMPDYLETRFAWVRTPYGYALGLPSASVAVVVDMLGHADLEIKQQHRRSEPMGTFNSEQAAIEAAEQAVEKLYPQDIALIDKNAHWRTSETPATPRQIALATKLKIRYPTGVTKGQLSMLIGQALAKKTKEKEGAV